MSYNSIGDLVMPAIFAFFLFWLTPFIISFIVSKVAIKGRKKSSPDEIEKNKEIEKSIYKTTLTTLMYTHIFLSVIIVSLNFIIYYPDIKVYEDALKFYPASFAYMIYSFIKANLTAAIFSVPYYIVTLISKIRKNKKKEKNNDLKVTESVQKDKEKKEPSKFSKKIKVIADFVAPIATPLTHIIIFCYRQLRSFIWLFAAFSYCTDSISTGIAILSVFGGCMLCYIIPFVYFVIMTARIRTEQNEDKKESLKKRRREFLPIFIVVIIFTALTLLACTGCFGLSTYTIPNELMSHAEAIIAGAYGLSF